MRRTDPVGGSVEVGKITAPDIDRADAKAHCASVDPVEINQPLQCRLQGRDVVEGERRRAAGRTHERWRQTRSKEVGCAEEQDAKRAGLIDQTMSNIVL